MATLSHAKTPVLLAKVGGRNGSEQNALDQ